jgi:hypothetical protein
MWAPCVSVFGMEMREGGTLGEAFAGKHISVVEATSICQVEKPDEHWKTHFLSRGTRIHHPFMVTLPTSACNGRDIRLCLHLHIADFQEEFSSVGLTAPDKHFWSIVIDTLYVCFYWAILYKNVHKVFMKASSLEGLILREQKTQHFLAWMDYTQIKTYLIILYAISDKSARWH